MRVVRAKLEGPDAALGRVAAADVARMIIGLERAIAHAAYLVLGRERRGTGRHRQAIESASRLRFVGVEEGSVVGLLALPDMADPSDEELPLPVADLSSLAMSRLIDAIMDVDPRADGELAGAVAKLAAELGIGDRYSSMTIIDESATGEGPRRATIDSLVRERMQRLEGQFSSQRDDVLVGVLVAADFEQLTARLRLAGNEAVTVSFPPDLADEIKDALRSRAGFEGMIHYRGKTARATRVELRAVVRTMQFPLEGESFWQPRSFSDLQAMQGVTGRVDPASLAIEELTTDERAAFLAALET